MCTEIGMCLRILLALRRAPEPVNAHTKAAPMWRRKRLRLLATPLALTANAQKKGCTAKDEVVQPVVDFIDSTAAYTKVEGYRITGENKSYDLSKENYEEYGYNILTAIIKDLVENEDINKDYLEIKSKKGLITYYEETKNDKNIGTLLTKLEADDVAVEIKYKGINNKISFSFVITEKSQYPVDETSDPSMFTRSIEVESLTLNDKAYKSFTATLGTDDGVNVKFTSATCEGKDVNLDILNAFISLTF